MNNFIVTFMKQLGFADPLKYNVIVIACGLVTNVISFYTFDKIGRLNNILWGAFILGAMILGVYWTTASGYSVLSPMTQKGVCRQASLVEFFFFFFFLVFTYIVI